MTKTAKDALSEAGVAEEVTEQVTTECMRDTEAQAAANLPTKLRKLTEAEFDRAYRHGWEVAECNFRAHRPDLFTEVPRGQRP
jgi:hypothetical protein